MTATLPRIVCFTALWLAALGPLAAPAAEETKDELNFKMSDEPTYIKADSLTLKANERIFYYEGNIEVLQGEMRLTSDKLEGRYDESNQIETLTALSNVIITKGESIRGTCQKAVYERKSETVVLSENPELQQDESVLTADTITLFLAEDRSAAEGNVRVKLVKSEEDKKPDAAGALTATKRGKKTQR